MQNIGRGIWRSSSKIKGPHVTLLGGIHGNELVGIHIIRRFQETCLPLVAGTLTVILGNPLAIESGTRGSRPHFDLNRCFSSDNLLNSNSNFEKDNENYEMTRARELAPYLAECDVMIDLHSTNKPSLPFIRIAGEIAKNMDVNSDTNIVNLILQYLPCDILLTDPTYLLAGHVSLTDEYVGACNGVGICYESGVASDLNAVDKVYDSLVCILKKFKMIDQNNIQTTTIPCFPPSQYTLSTVRHLLQHNNCIKVYRSLISRHKASRGQTVLDNITFNAFHPIK